MGGGSQPLDTAALEAIKFQPRAPPLAPAMAKDWGNRFNAAGSDSRLAQDWLDGAVLMLPE